LDKAAGAPKSWWALAYSTSLPDILDTIAQRRHALFGHIRRLASDTLVAHTALHIVVSLRQHGGSPDITCMRPRNTSLGATTRRRHW